MFKKVKTTRVYEVVAEQIEESILSGHFKPGDRLPAERSLVNEFGVSRRTLREAMRIIQQKGLIEIKAGAKGGSFVKELTTDSMRETLGLLIRSNKVSLFEVVQYRLDTETMVTSRAAQRATKTDIDRLQKIIADGEALLETGALDWKSFIEIDRQVHVTLASVARNPIHEYVLKTIHENVSRYFENYLHRDDEAVARSFSDLVKIVDAVAKGQSKKAFNLAKSHLERVYQQIDKRLHRQVIEKAV